MKKIALSALALVIFGLAAATPVSDSAMHRVAVNFWNTYRTPDAKPVQSLQRIHFEGLSHIAIYRNGDEGFIILSADDRVRPVLAYSFDSPFPEQLHPSLRYWLGGYESQIAEIATTHDTSADPRWQHALTATPPEEPLMLANIPAMLTTHWDQSDPYNRLCPYDNAHHERTVVGCVATAMAQILRYWRHPSCGVGQHSYHYGNYDTLHADFSNTTYIWQYMPERLDISSPQRQINAVDVLSYHCGVAVNMMYGPSSTGGSGAYSQDVTTALSTYFRYKPNMNYQYRNGHSDSLWRTLIDEQLSAGRPIYYSGRDSTGGHAFVLDGSDTSGRYHFNWGWGGYGDAFYALNDLAPRSGGAGGNATYTFNQHQSAIFGIEPIPQTFDTVDYFDTVCHTEMYYTFHEYELPPTEGEWILTHLDTVYRVHVSVAPRRFIHYDPNGGEGLTYTSPYCYTKGVRMLDALFTREGYTFQGWCLDPNGNGTIYQPGDSLKIHSTVIAYAIWSRKNGIDQPTEPNIILQPNPATEYVEVSVTGGCTREIKLIDAMGRTILQSEIRNSEFKIPLRDLPKGVYLMVVSTDNGTCKQRLIKH